LHIYQPKEDGASGAGQDSSVRNQVLIQNSLKLIPVPVPVGVQVIREPHPHIGPLPEGHVSKSVISLW
jgi:hypothetical protein